MLQIGPSIRNVVAFMPFDERSTRYYRRFYHRVRLPLVAQLFELALGWRNRHIEADRAIIEFCRRLPRLVRLSRNRSLMSSL